MPFSLQNNEKILDSGTEERIPEISFKQKRKQDALDLALLVYDMYKESQMSDRIMEINRSDND